MKTCTKCQIEKSPESFYKDGDGLRAECKVCTLAARAKFKEQVDSDPTARAQYLQYFRDRYVKNAKKIKAQNLKYAQAHRDEINAYATKYREQHREELKKKDQARQPQSSARLRRYYAAHPEKRAVQNTKYHTRSRTAAGTCTAEQMKARFEVYGNCCAYCGAPAKAADHVVALTRGGSNWPANIRPACTSCNSSKGAKKLALWKAEQSAARSSPAARAA